MVAAVPTILVVVGLSGSITLTGKAQNAEEMAAEESEVCVAASVEDSFDIDGVEPDREHNVVIKNVSFQDSLSFYLTSGEAKSDKQTLSPNSKVSLAFTPKDTKVVLNLDNTRNSRSLCLYAFVKEIPAKPLEPDTREERCVPAAQSLGQFVSKVEKGGVYNVTVENSGTEGDLQASVYGTGILPSRPVAVKAGKKAVLKASGLRDGPMYLRLNNLVNLTRACADVSFQFVGVATATPTFLPRPTVTPRATSAVITRCVPGSQQDSSILLGFVSVGQNYSVGITNSSTANTVAVSLRVGTTAGQIFNVGPLKTINLPGTALATAPLYLTVDNRGNPDTTCVLVRPPTIPGSALTIPTLPLPTVSQSGVRSVCVDGGKMNSFVNMGHIDANRAYSVLVSNTSLINTVEVTFIRGLSKTTVFTIFANKTSAITVSSTAAGTLYMQVDNRKNQTSTCVSYTMR